MTTPYRPLLTVTGPEVHPDAAALEYRYNTNDPDAEYCDLCDQPVGCGCQDYRREHDHGAER